MSDKKILGHKVFDEGNCPITVMKYYPEDIYVQNMNEIGDFLPAFLGRET